MELLIIPMHKRSLLVLLSLILLSANGCARKFTMPAESLNEKSSWQFYHLNTESTGHMDGVFSGKLDVAWEQSSGSHPSGPLTLCNGYLICPGSKKKIKFYDSATGSYRGFLRTKGHSPTGLVILDSLGFYVDGPRKYVLHCVNLLNRKTIWETTVKDAACGSIIINDNIILSLTEGSVLAFDLKTGAKKWSFEAKERLLAPASATGELICQPGDQGTLFMISSINGQELKRTKFANPLLGSASISELVFVADMAGNVYAVNRDSDNVIWKSAVSGEVWCAPAVDGQRVYVATNAGEVSAFQAHSGEKIWSFDAKEVIKSSPIVVGDFVIVGTMSGKLYAFKSIDGSVAAMRQFSGAISQAPVSDGRLIYVVSNDGELFCLGDANEIAALYK